MITDEDQLILKTKYAAPQICTMDDKMISRWSKALLLKIHVITGWVIPNTELLNILIDQFEKKLKEDYDMLNTEEIEFAFRRGGTTVKDWGKEMNLNLLDQVLIPYVSRRIDASSNEEKQKRPPLQQRIYTDEEILNERRAELETAYQAMRTGKFPLIHSYFEQILRDDGFLLEGENINEFFVRALNKQFKNLYINESNI